MSGSVGPSSSDARTAITILVLGDEGVGKSSLISTFVARHFSEVLPGLMTQVRLPPDPDSNCITTIVDSQAGDLALSRYNKSETSLSSLLQPGKGVGDIPAATQQQNVDSIILVYDLDRADTFYRLENHWLPLIERVFDGEIPVIVAGNKADLVRPTPTGVNEEQSLVRGRQQIISLLQRFRFVRQCIKCSAKNLLRIQDVFVKAQQAVMYPFAPLFDLQTGTLTRDCKKALTRIFRMYDQDHDGLLSNAELDNFQYQTFKFPLENRDVVGWKKVVARNTNEEVVRDGKFTVAGFLTIFDVFISQNRLDVPWKVLRKFGYSDDLELTIPADKKISSSSSRLSTSARNFLAALFIQFDSDGDGELSSRDLAEIFSIVPEPALPPWHPMRAPTVLEGCFSLPAQTNDEPSSPASSTNPMELSVSASGITIASSSASFPTVGDFNLNAASSTDHIHLEPMNFMEWMGHWHMLASISPAAARAELFRLGHVGSSSDSKQRSKQRRKKTDSEELCIYVVGSPGCGKTCLLNVLCQKSDGDNDGTATTLEPTRSPETCTTHKKFKRKTTEKEEEVVVHYIFTEVPRQYTDSLGPLLKSRSKYCLVVFMFDSEESCSDAIALEKQLLNDDIPRVYLVTKKDNAAMKAATAHTRDLDLEDPYVVVSSSTDDCRDAILTHLAQCGGASSSLFKSTTANENNCKKSRPHAEQKRREAARRRKMIWALGGLVSVSVAVAVGVFFGGKERKVVVTRFGWLTDIIFGRAASRNDVAAEM